MYFIGLRYPASDQKGGGKTTLSHVGTVQDSEFGERISLQSYYSAGELALVREMVDQVAELTDLRGLEDGR